MTIRTALACLFVVFCTVVMPTLSAAQFGGGNNGNGNGNGGGFGNGGGNGNGNNGNGNGNGGGNGSNGGGNGNGNNGNGNGNGGPNGTPLPLLGGTILGHAALVSGGYLVWRRRQKRTSKI